MQSAAAGPFNWVLEQSPSSETLNGISAPSTDFAIAVGNNGVIVHYLEDGSSILVDSGTDKDLLDVFVASPSLAVATGRDIALIWDGTSWEPIKVTDTDALYTGTWISPEGDVVLYGQLGSPFSFICPYHPPNPQPFFCAGYPSPMVAACGRSNDIKALMASGDVLHLNNVLGDVSGPDPIHDEPGDLFLTAIFVPPGACVTGATPPTEMFAINSGSDIMHFDGSSWSSMNVTLGENQTLNWLSGTGPNQIVAVGFEPNGGAGNDAVVYYYDGASWTEDDDLPPGSPGLIDVAATTASVTPVSRSSIPASGSLKTGVTSGGRSQLEDADEIRVVGEMGLQLLTGIAPLKKPDLTVTKTNNVGGSIMFGESFIWTLHVENIGEADAVYPLDETSIDTILQDHFPENIQITGFSLANLSDVIGEPDCSVVFVDNLLTCIRFKQAVTIKTGGSFDVLVTVTPLISGTFVNPIPKDPDEDSIIPVCQVDPDEVLDESEESNNTCEDTVIVQPAPPDLVGTKISNTGAITLGSSFVWTVAVANQTPGGGVTISFADGNVILQDDLPEDGTIYGDPQLSNIGNITNSDNIDCSIANNRLTCMAKGAEVTFGSRGLFNVSFEVTPFEAGTLSNPAEDGICRVDPEAVIEGEIDSNNDCSHEVQVLPLEGVVSINAGMNDAWVSSDAPFQGFFFTVFPVLELFFLAEFSFDTVPPGHWINAVFGAADQRWVTGAGGYSGNRVTLNIELTTDGAFNTSEPLAFQLPGYGTIDIVFISCNEAILTYNYPTLGIFGQLTLTRVVASNVALCQTLGNP